MTDDNDLIRRGDALKLVGMGADWWGAHAAINALPAVTPAVRVKPLRFFVAEGGTFSQMREHARSHPLAREGDMQLVWANEGDLHLNAYPLDLTPAAAPDARCAECDCADGNCTWIKSDEPDVAGLVDALRHIDSITVHSGGDVRGVTADMWKAAFEEVQAVASAALTATEARNG
jgi:hypothetical protein